MPPAGFEPATLRLKVVYSTQLSYGGKKESIFKVREERADPFPHPLTIAPNGLAVKPGNRRFGGGKPPDDEGEIRTHDPQFRKLLRFPLRHFAFFPKLISLFRYGLFFFLQSS